MLIQDPLLAKLRFFCNIENEFVLKYIILDKDIYKLNLTNIKGHYTVPEESFENVDEKAMLDDNVNNNTSETSKIMDLLVSILHESNN